MSLALRGFAALLLLPALGCAAVYPELTTPVRMPATQAPEPPPPADLFWIAVREGTAPERTKDGRAWQELGGKLPDPFVKVLVNGRELIRTNPESNTLHPTWPDSPRGNFRIRPDDKLRVEMWQEGLVQAPICVRNVGGDPSDWVASRQLRVSCDGGAEVVLAWEPAHARVGYGFYYELRTESVYVTRVFEESPAARAGLKPGDEITGVDGLSTRNMKAGELQGHFNAQRTEGVEIQFRHTSKEDPNKITLKEGAIYPLFSENGSMP